MRLARSIRRSAERVQNKEYGQPPSEVDLAGWCAVTSNVLFEELTRRGIRSRLVWNRDHCFLTYGRYLIDITATQFNHRLPKVVKKLRSSKTRATFYWVERKSEHTLAGRKKNRDWAASTGSFQQPWQHKVRAHLRTLK